MHLAKLTQTVKYHFFLYLIEKDIKGLNIGSGGSNIPDFVNMDASMFTDCDIIAKGNNRLKFRKGSVSTIYCSHMFEHIPRRRTGKILKSWYSVLKPEGKLYICVPDMEALCQIYLDNIKVYDSEYSRFCADMACDIMYGGQASGYDFHFYGYSFATLRSVLESVGFRNVEKFDRAKLNLPFEDACSSARIKYIPISLNVEATK
jgi:predicted SAM-dependent methyltransferase